ncbi:MAG: serine/threonine protein kinase [Candidatus Viridilinea halotolerans]|uniref:Serine/threonine protein kinase n=1 Tax=Candidatus Viridilinea halotolerans TaxID=2491704 RepID=A0A426U2Q9_9CHLR|nr:MAG: serine/threonine protein kinase [Candidatus Viridilinea halotolerans]
MLEPGAILQDRYKVIAAIGKGGMGSVYRARDLRLRTDVALKETLFNDEVYRRAFEHEAQVLARLRHQALPRVIDHFIEGPGQFLVMEFIHGEDLGNQLVRLGQRFATPQAMPMILRWADQLLDALHYLHTRPSPVYHRDIKPKNLKLTQTYDIILLDFGLARGGMTVAVSPDEVADAAANERKIYGFTPPYAPIEQMRDGEPDTRSDLYALGATMYHLLTASLPADAMTRMARMIKGQPDPLKPICSIVSHVPEAIATVVEHSLAVMLDDRPASAREMRIALSQARSGRRPAAAPTIVEAQSAGVAAPPPTPTHVTTEPHANTSVSQPVPPMTGMQPSLTSFPGTITPSMIQPTTQPEAVPFGTLLRMLTTGSPIRSIAFSPSGDLLAAGYDDHTIGIWNLKDYTHLATLKGHSSSVRGVCFAPHGGLLASGSDDESLRLWRVADGSSLRRLHIAGCPIESIAFSPDGNYLAAGGWGGTIALCAVEDTRITITENLPCPFVHSLAFSPDGQILAAGAYDGTIYRWDVRDQRALQPLAGFSTIILALAFSPDGEYLAASSNTSVQVWRTSDQRPIEQFRGHNGPIHDLAFSPDSSLLATGSEDKTVRLWRIGDGTMIPISLDHRAGVATISYSPNGILLATGSHDGRIYLWKVGG